MFELILTLVVANITFEGHYVNKNIVNDKARMMTEETLIIKIKHKKWGLNIMMIKITMNLLMLSHL